MDLRYFEIHDLLCDAVIALEAGDYPAVEARLRKALAWLEQDWLATPADRPAATGPVRSVVDDADDEDYISRR